MMEKEMWAAYCQKHPECEAEAYDAWCYGSDMPDLLARLMLEGIKTATASAYPMYQYEGCDLPKADGYNVILNSRGEAVCITRTLSVEVTPFSRVSARHAYNEGEGDRSLDYWRRVHEEVFSAELAEAGMTFTRDMSVVCEEFIVVYPETR